MTPFRRARVALDRGQPGSAVPTEISFLATDRTQRPIEGAFGDGGLFPLAPFRLALTRRW